MKKIKSTLANMILSLTIISILMSFALGFVYIETKEPIDKSQQEKLINAIREVLPPFDNDPTKNAIKMEDNLVLYRATNKGKKVGTAVKTYSQKVYSGTIILMVGFLPNGTIHNISVLDQKETPGLGSKMTEPTFKDQFKCKNPKEYKLSVKQDGGDVDAITASTISSRAFCDAVERAYNAFKKKNQ